MLKLISLQNPYELRSSMLQFTALITLIFWLSACSDKQPTTTIEGNSYYHLAQSKVLKKQQGYTVPRKFSGLIVSKQRASLNFEVSGRVAEVMVDEGDLVSKGQVLATLDTDLLYIEQQLFNAQLVQLQAEIDLTNSNLKRLDSLIKKGYASQQNLDELNAQKKVQLANQQQIEANISANQYKINHSEINAAFNGTINQRGINVGEVVTPQISAFELQQTGNNELKVGVPQKLIDEIRQQKDYVLDINEQPIKVSNLAINSEINPQSRTVQLRFAIPDNISVFNNQLAYFEFQQHYQAQGFWVPISSLTDGVRGTWNVMTLKKQNTNTKQQSSPLYELLSHSVEVIHTEANRAYIRGSLADGQLILSSGLQRLVPGQLVRNESQISAQTE